METAEDKDATRSSLLVPRTKTKQQQQWRANSRDGGSTVTLWLQTQLPRNTRPVKVTLTSASGNEIPTFGSTMRELNLERQLFLRMFICAKVKTPILGRGSSDSD